MGCMGRKPQGFTAKTVMLPPELWDRLERFRVDEHLSSVAEAMRVLLWRALGDQPKAPSSPATPRHLTPKSRRAPS